MSKPVVVVLVLSTGGAGCTTRAPQGGSRDAGASDRAKVSDSGATRPKTHAATPGSAVGPLDLEAPPGPIPGRIDVTLSGAISMTAEGTAVQCTAYETHRQFIVNSGDVYDAATFPNWQLRVANQWHEDTKAEIFFYFSADGSSGSGYRTDLDLETLARAYDEDRAFKLDHELRGDDESLRITGLLACARQPTIERQRDALMGWLGRATGLSVRPYYTTDFGRERESGGVSVIIPDKDAVAALPKLRAALGRGWVAFLGTTRFLGDEKPEGIELVVAPGGDQWDVLRLARSNAVNYGLSTEGLIGALSALHDEVPLRIDGANTDTVRVTIMADIIDKAGFAKKVYAICPDIVDQGVGTVEVLESQLGAGLELELWWD